MSRYLGRTGRETRVLLDLVVTEPTAGVTVIAVIGELDMSSAPRLREAIIAAATRHRPGIVLDLSGVDLLDPTGLGVIFDGVKRTRALGGDLVLCGLAPHVRRDLDLLRVSEILEVLDTLESATRTLTPGTPHDPGVA